MKLLRSIAYFASIGVLSQLIGQNLPRHWFHETSFFYRLRRWEQEGRIYLKLHIQKWKDHVPDMSRHVRKMTPKRVGGSITSEQVQRLIQETCVAELIHNLLCIFGAGVLNIWEDAAGIIVWVLYVLGNLPFILIQRYNRPRLIRLRQTLKKREERNNPCVS